MRTSLYRSRTQFFWPAGAVKDRSPIGVNDQGHQMSEGIANLRHQSPLRLCDSTDDEDLMKPVPLRFLQFLVLIVPVQRATLNFDVCL
jgi:hypothetical protein